MRNLNSQIMDRDVKGEDLPERMIQFGEGNFLRGFIDWMVHRLNQQELYNGRIVAIQPTPHGKVVPKLNEQDGLYTLVLRGVSQGVTTDHAEIISSISRGINPYEDWQEVLKLAESPDVTFVFSNTTEAGLTYTKEDYDPIKSPLSYPGKLTAFLYHRYQQMNGSAHSGLTIIPCELLEDNGQLLKHIVLRIAVDWRLPKEFTNWVEKHNRFCNTLVDRIVTGYPKDHIDEFRERLGYEDKLLTVGEPYHLFVIEAEGEVCSSLPFHKAGLNVHWGMVKPFRELKVRILNGAHTMMFAMAYLSGKNTVLEAMEDPTLRELIDHGIYEEILPVLDQKLADKKHFAASVVERFLNPFNKHLLVDIGMNASFKYKTRLLPTLIESYKKDQKLPKVTVFSLAAMISYYQPRRVEGNLMMGRRGDGEYPIRDTEETMAFFRKVWANYDGTEDQLKRIVRSVLGNQALWGKDLNEITGLPEAIEDHLLTIMNHGMKKAVGIVTSR